MLKRISKPYDAANWIWHPTADMDNAYVDFISELFLPDEFEKVILNISSDSNYNLWINGKLASATQYADYAGYKVYDEIDITGQVCPRRNRLCVIGYCQGEDSHIYRRGNPGVLYWVTVDGVVFAVSGGSAFCRLAPDYVSGEMERITGQLSFSFYYDASKQDNWLDADYEPSAEWVPVKVRKRTDELYPRPIAKLITEQREQGIVLSQGFFADAVPPLSKIGDRMQYAGLNFCRFSEMTGLEPPVQLPVSEGLRFAGNGGDGLYAVIDMKQETAGFLDLELELEEEAEVLIGYGEHLDDLRVRTAVGGRQFAARYRGKKGRQHFVHRFKRMGCRYLQLHIYAHAFTLYYAGILPTVYPLEDKGRFHCGDGLHNKIYEVCLRTLRLCAHEHYEDCPWREQALYAMDSRNQMLCGYYAFGEYAMPKASLRLLALGQRSDGLLEMCAPSRSSITIPAFSLCFVAGVYEYALYSGDLSFVQELMPCLQHIMHCFMARMTAEDLVPCFTEPEYWNFYEWNDGLDGGSIQRDYAIEETYDAPLNGFFMIALQNYGGLCRMLHLQEQAARADSIFQRVRLAVNRTFWNEEQGAYCTTVKNGEQSHYSELAQSLLLCGGAADGQKSGILLNQLAYPTGRLMPITLSCSIYKYEALMTEPERYAELVFRTIEKIWGDMLFAGSTSFWETQRGAWDFSNAGSLCHGWSAIPVYFYYAYALGIKPNQKKRKPVPCGLGGVSGNSCIRTDGFSLDTGKRDE